jgi:hypothetical protein
MPGEKNAPRRADVPKPLLQELIICDGDVQPFPGQQSCIERAMHIGHPSLD